jgi:hypothetical protein
MFTPYVPGHESTVPVITPELISRPFGRLFAVKVWPPVPPLAVIGAL